MEKAFHSCGWNGAADIRIGKLGSDAFKTLSSAVLAAIVSSKKISLKIEDNPGAGCAANRIDVLGLRIEM